MSKKCGKVLMAMVMYTSMTVMASDKAITTLGSPPRVSGETRSVEDFLADTDATVGLSKAKSLPNKSLPNSGYQGDEDDEDGASTVTKSCSLPVDLSPKK